MSMFVVSADTPGIEILRNVATMEDSDELDHGIHGYVRYNQVRVPLDAMLGGPGEGLPTGIGPQNVQTRAQGESEQNDGGH